MWDEEKKNKANLCKNSERLIIVLISVNKTVTTLQQLEIILPVLLLGFAVTNNLGVTLVIAIGFKLRCESNCFQYIWS